MRRKWLSGTLCALGVAIVGAPEKASAQAPARLDVWLLDIGQGSCVYVDCPDGQTSMLIDCGSLRRSAVNDQGETVSWLKGKIAAKSNHSVVISHADQDHYNIIGGSSIAPERTKRVFLGGLREDFRGNSDWLRAINEWLDTVDANGEVHVLANDAFIRN